MEKQESKISILWTPTDDLEEIITSQSERRKEGLMALYKEYPDTKTYQELLEKELGFIKIMELIFNDPSLNVAQTIVDISYDIREKECTLPKKICQMLKNHERKS
jgi:hypothetical protein